MKRSELKRKTPLKRGDKQLRRSAPKKRSRSFTPASNAQRKKVANLPCVVCGRDCYSATIIDAMHLTPRAWGGRNDPLCTVAGCRRCHRQFDDGELSILEHLVTHDGRYRKELQHMLEHMDSPVQVVERLANERVEYRRVAA